MGEINGFMFIIYCYLLILGIISSLNKLVSCPLSHYFSSLVTVILCRRSLTQILFNVFLIYKSYPFPSYNRLIFFISLIVQKHLLNVFIIQIYILFKKSLIFREYLNCLDLKNFCNIICYIRYTPCYIQV